MSWHFPAQEALAKVGKNFNIIFIRMPKKFVIYICEKNNKMDCHKNTKINKPSYYFY